MEKEKEAWQEVFLNAGTKAGCGDLSMMIGVVTEIREKAYEAGFTHGKVVLAKDVIKYTDGIEDLRRIIGSYLVKFSVQESEN